MDCLDESLHLQILTALAGNLAKTANVSKPDKATAGVEPEEAISVLLKGFPGQPIVQDGNKENVLRGDEEDEEEWSEFEINHAISYAHYVVSLPKDSSYLGSALPRLNQLISGLLSQGGPHTSAVSSPSSSSAFQHGIGGEATVHQAQLCEALIRAVLWVGWAQETAQDEVGAVLQVLLEEIGIMLKSDRSPVFPLSILHCIHSTLNTCPLLAIPSRHLSKLLHNLMDIASPSNLVKLVQKTGSRYSTPNHIAHEGPFVSSHPHTPSEVVMVVTEIANIVLASAILPFEAVQQDVFVRPLETLPYDTRNITYVPAKQIRALLSAPVDAGRPKLNKGSEGQEVMEETGKMALRWWTELQGIGLDIHAGDSGFQHRDSLFSIGAGGDEEVELSVAILHLMNMLTLHQDEAETSQIARLRLLLSDTSTVSDARVLEAAFVCTSILVRNQPSLGTGMTHHIRRLLVGPLPAFEGGMGSVGGDIPPAVAAASKCLAICMTNAPSSDLVSSTLYSLLNTLTHAGSTLAGAGAPSVKSFGVMVRAEEGTIRTNLSGGKRSEEQRRLVAVTAVEVVSRLALEIGEEDIIHLTISLLLQRLRGVDLLTEATIVTNLVSLALAGSNSDLIEIYRAFSQIARASHPEDPRMASNAVLAAQTTLARGLGTRLDCADGYLVELLVLFADKGTQTQMIAMAPAGYESRDREKYSQLQRESDARVADMKSWLGALLVPIATLLEHEQYHPDHNAPPELVAHFRNLWFLCVVFGLTGATGRKRLQPHELNALSVIAEKTPALIVESANDFVNSELEYNSTLRKDFASSVQSSQRLSLQQYLPNQKLHHHFREMTTPQTTMLMAIYDLEEMRTQRWKPSVLLQYFANQSVNDSSLSSCMDAIVTRISSNFLKSLSQQVVIHSMPPDVPAEVCKILIACTHRYKKVREVALSYARQILETFSALMCDRDVVFTLLEILTLMRRSCELHYTDEYSPIYEFKSDKLDLTLILTDDYAVRNEIVTTLHGVARHWLTLAISRAPIELQSTLQSYLIESRDVLLIDSVEMGAGLALHYSKAISRLDRQETLMPVIGGWPSDSSNLVASQFAAKNYFHGELSGARHILGRGLENLQKDSPAFSSLAEMVAFKSQMAKAVNEFKTKTKQMHVPDIRRLLLRAVSVTVASPAMDSDIIHYLVELPMAAFTPLAIAAGVDAWTWLLRQRPGAQVAIIGEISAGWLETIRAKKGLFSSSMDYDDPFVSPVEYSPSDKKIMDLELAKARRLLRPHLLLIQVLSSQFQAVKYKEPGIMMSIIRLMMRSMGPTVNMSTHPLAREVRFSLLLFGFQILASSKLEALLELRLRDRLFAAAFSWFSVRPQWSFGSDRIQVGAEIKLLQDFLVAVRADAIRGDHFTSSMSDRQPALLIRGASSLSDYSAQHQERVRLLALLIENEISRLTVWSNPLADASRSSAPPGQMEKGVTMEDWPRIIRKAWQSSPAMAVHMGERFKHTVVQAEITKLVRNEPKKVIHVAEALHFLLGDRIEPASRPALKWLPVWAAVPPVTALVYFQPRYGNHPLILQYGMRVLEQHPVDLTFFFVPQVVQALRTDQSGYVERFIFETSKISQLFCHQIIWNMKANTYRGDDADEEDSMKPLLDRMIDMIVAGLSGKAKAFYDLEFNFFDEVTSISGKLKPYIKKSKPEKKAKIDEEMAKIKLSIGVYLPSNPDGSVIDIDRKSGRPLQSHAKAPFMATFKVQKERLELPSDSNMEVGEQAVMVKQKYDVWQSAIFKVGDDCRQDVLALQIIAMFKNVFTGIGLVLYLYPYRVTATAPGCGVIDVVPNATSRDEMGRAKINDLFEYFVDKYGGVDTVPFQKARLNFIQSMAAYSVACYILQIKDRHNGNIMIDAEGHIVHIDFGFLFDIGPGGIKFEPNSFKLNHEMVALMGGRDSQGYKMFSELTVKAFLAIRPHADQLIDTAHLMLGTELPSFQGEPTIKRLRQRFMLHLGERQAADYMMGVIRNAHENMRSGLYDGFQKLQNGIPY